MSEENRSSEVIKRLNEEKKHRQNQCYHRKGNGKPNLVGWEDTKGDIFLLCQGCLKEFNLPAALIDFLSSQESAEVFNHDPLDTVVADYLRECRQPAWAAERFGKWQRIGGNVTVRHIDIKDAVEDGWINPEELSVSDLTQVIKDYHGQATS